MTDRRVTDVRAAARDEAADLILRAATADPGLVVALDFSFSLPAWWLEACGIGEVAELWADRDRLEGWLADCPPPFWGRPGCRRPLHWPGPDLRRTELAAPGRPKSTFQIGGSGAVGTASIRGWPVLARLRAAGLAVWPFDAWRPPVVVEAWPRLALGPVVKRRETARRAWVEDHADHLDPAVAEAATGSDDALDAVATALDQTRRAGHVRPVPTDPVVALEGWIDGVPDPGAMTPVTATPPTPARRGE